MPTEMSVQSIFQIVSEEKLGFSFGKPDRPSVESLACILPILRTTSQKRQYITYPETEEVIVTDSGSINKINLKNTSKENVFFRSGTIFQGKGTQSRALTRSSVVFPKQEVSLDCRCVHASHAIRTGSGFEYGGVTPLSVDSSFYTTGYTPGTQHSMWDSVRSVSATMSSASAGVTPNRTPTMPESVRGRLEKTERRPRSATARSHGNRINFGAGSLYASSISSHSLMADGSPASPNFEEPEPTVGGIGMDNLHANVTEFAKNFDDILSKARLHDNQVGLALITDKGCKTIELFDLDASWEATHKDAVKRMGTELLRGPDNTNVFEYKPQNAVNAVRAVLALPFKTNKIYEHKPSNGECAVEIWGLTANRFVGEAVEIDGRLMHLVVLETN